MQATNNKTQNTLPVCHLPFLIENRSACSRLPARRRCFLWQYPTLSPLTSTVLLAEGGGGGEAFWSDNGGSNWSIPPTLLLASSGLPKFMAENFNGQSCRRRMQSLRSEKGGRNRGLGFHFFGQWVFYVLPFSHFYFLFFGFLLFPTFFFYQGQNRHPLSSYVNQGPS